MDYSLNNINRIYCIDCRGAVIKLYSLQADTTAPINVNTFGIPYKT